VVGDGLSLEGLYAERAEERRGKGGRGLWLTLSHKRAEQRSIFSSAAAKWALEMKCGSGLLLLAERF